MKTGGYFMNNKNYQVEKLCGFYVSDWHLTTTILPYINSKIDEKTKVITILENNIEENIKVLMKKLNLKNFYFSKFSLFSSAFWTIAFLNSFFCFCTSRTSTILCCCAFVTFAIVYLSFSFFTFFASTTVC